jgi:hypothetical protein
MKTVSTPGNGIQQRTQTLYYNTRENNGSNIENKDEASINTPERDRD